MVIQDTGQKDRPNREEMVEGIPVFGYNIQKVLRARSEMPRTSRDRSILSNRAGSLRDEEQYFK